MDYGVYGDFILVYPKPIYPKPYSIYLGGTIEIISSFSSVYSKDDGLEPNLGTPSPKPLLSGLQGTRDDVGHS